ncbi:hypothetical protein PanWU01x14_177820, partial [Parasponia andersonii]
TKILYIRKILRYGKLPVLFLTMQQVAGENILQILQLDGKFKRKDVSCHLSCMLVSAETKFLSSSKCSSFDIWSESRRLVINSSCSQLKGPDACSASIVQR